MFGRGKTFTGDQVRQFVLDSVDVSEEDGTTTDTDTSDSDENFSDTDNQKKSSEEDPSEDESPMQRTDAALVHSVKELLIKER